MIRVDIKDMQREIKVDRRFIRRVVRGTLKIEAKERMEGRRGKKIREERKAEDGKEARDGEVSIVLTDNEYIRELNRKYRSVDRETDVLAFPMDEEILGDIVISVEKAKQQARVYRKSFENELGRLLIHGVLHLIGYDDSSREKSRKMHTRQEQILKQILRRFASRTCP